MPCNNKYYSIMKVRDREDFFERFRGKTNQVSSKNIVSLLGVMQPNAVDGTYVPRKLVDNYGLSKSINGQSPAKPEHRLQQYASALESFDSITRNRRNSSRELFPLVFPNKDKLPSINSSNLEDIVLRRYKSQSHRPRLAKTEDAEPERPAIITDSTKRYKTHE